MFVCKNRKWQSMLWIFLYLILMDLIVNVIFKFPDNPQIKAPTMMQEYFEYGRSIEGKFKKMAFAAKLQVNPTQGYGWLKGQQADSQPSKAGENQILVAVYGMSHTKYLGDAIANINSKYSIRSVCAPGAPIDWGYEAYVLDKRKHSSEVIIWGIMTDTVPFIGATMGASIYFDLGHPYTFPRHYVENGEIKTLQPPFLSLEGFEEHRNNRVKWSKYLKWLKDNDKFYNPLLFKENLLDNSAIVRVVRRAYAQTVYDSAFNRVYSKNEFITESEEIKTLLMMVKLFADNVRRHNKIPIIYIVNNRGRGDSLYRALKPTLDGEKIPFLSSHIICPPDDPKSFRPNDGHFAPERDIELAKEIIKIIENERYKN